jgi:hypothetical protein
MAAPSPIIRFGWAACGLLAVMPVFAVDLPRDRATLVAVLERALEHERGWPRIKAAEALADHGHSDRAFAALSADADTTPPEQRIGVWRVLARTAPTATGRQQFLERIRVAAFAPDGPDRVHAVESLAKLGAYQEADRKVVEAMAAGDPAAAFPRWYLALSGRREDEARLVELLDAPDPIARWRAAYGIARLKDSSAAARAAVAARADRELSDSPARTVVISAAYLLSVDAGRDRWHRRLVDTLKSGSVASRAVAFESLGRQGTSADLDILAKATVSPDGLVRVAAASASLHILERERPRK